MQELNACVVFFACISVWTNAHIYWLIISIYGNTQSMVIAVFMPQCQKLCSVCGEPGNRKWTVVSMRIFTSTNCCFNSIGSIEIIYIPTDQMHNFIETFNWFVWFCFKRIQTLKSVVGWSTKCIITLRTMQNWFSFCVILFVRRIYCWRLANWQLANNAIIEIKSKWPGPTQAQS